MSEFGEQPRVNFEVERQRLIGEGKSIRQKLDDPSTPREEGFALRQQYADSRIELAALYRFQQDPTLYQRVHELRRQYAELAGLPDQVRAQRAQRLVRAQIAEVAQRLPQGE